MLKTIGFNKIKYHTKKLNNLILLNHTKTVNKIITAIFLRLFNLLYKYNNEMT